MRRAGAISAVLAVLAAVVAGALLLLNRPRGPKIASIATPSDDTTMDADGAVRSVQGADLILPITALEEIWTPTHLERLARTYWRFLTRCTLGLVRVMYREDGRDIVLLTRPLTLLSFHAPEYAMDSTRGIVRWRIEKGVLVAPTGRGADGYLEIEVDRCEDVGQDCARLHVEVAVANFYPVLASRIATWFYKATQSRIHVIITHGFLRSLARLDFAESKVGRFAPARDDVPDPRPRREVAAA